MAGWRRLRELCSGLDPADGWGWQGRARRRWRLSLSYTRSLLGAMAEVGDPGGDGIWGSGEETDIWSKGGRWIIGLVFWWLVRGRFLGAQCP
jgi:hypothetical protein